MAFFTAALAAASAYSSYKAGKEQRKAGKAARREAELQAQSILRQRKAVSRLADQQHFDRLMQLKDLASTNEAFAAFMGRSDRSIKALQKREQRKYAEDVRRISLQEAMELGRLEEQADVERRRGENLSKQYKIQSRGTTVSSLLKAADLYDFGELLSAPKPNTTGNNSPSLRSAPTGKPGMTGGGIFY
jgi:hypothetical protein